AVSIFHGSKPYKITQEKRIRACVHFTRRWRERLHSTLSRQGRSLPVTFIGKFKCLAALLAFLFLQKISAQEVDVKPAPQVNVVGLWLEGHHRTSPDWLKTYLD